VTLRRRTRVGRLNRILLVALGGNLLAAGRAAPVLIDAPAPPASAAAPDKEAVELPPYLVSEFKPGDSRWKYVAAPGYEVLSRCDEHTTLDFVGTFILRERELREMLPESLVTAPSTPTALILITPAIARAMGDQWKRVSDSPSSKDRSPHPNPASPYRLEMVPQIVLYDTESIGRIYVVSNVEESDYLLKPEHVEQLLNRRTPPLPYWYRTGILTLFRETNWNVRRNFGGLPFGRASWFSARDDAYAEIAPLNWPRSGTRERAGNMDRPPENLLPLGELFAGPFDGQREGPTERFNLWSAQIGLFLRWVFDEKSGALRLALRNFVDRSTREPVTETLFRECFHRGFADVERELIAYFPRAKKTLALLEVDSIKLPELAIRNATSAEVGRIKGDFDMKELAYVMASAPAYRDQYVGQATADLLGPYEKGVRDPGFLAVLGDYYLKIGDRPKARLFLEQAANGRVARPSAYNALARIRLADALQVAAAGSLDRRQVGGLMRLLRESSLYAPPQLDTYVLAAEVWSHSPDRPAEDDLAFLDRGVLFFPGSRELAASVALLRFRANPNGQK